MNVKKNLKWLIRCAIFTVSVNLFSLLVMLLYVQNKIQDLNFLIFLFIIYTISAILFFPIKGTLDHPLIYNLSVLLVHIVFSVIMILILGHWYTGWEIVSFFWVEIFSIIFFAIVLLIDTIFILVNMLSVLLSNACSSHYIFDYEKVYKSKKEADKEIKNFVNQNSDLLKNAAGSMLKYKNNIVFNICYDETYKFVATQTVWREGEMKAPTECDNAYVNELMRKGFSGKISYYEYIGFGVVKFDLNYLVKDNTYEWSVFVYIKNEDDIDEYVDSLNSRTAITYKSQKICPNFFLIKDDR